MKIIGYSWAQDINEEEDSPDENTMLVRQYMRRRRWTGPVQLEEVTEAFIEFHLRARGKELVSSLRSGDVLLVPDQGYLFRTASQGVDILQHMRRQKIGLHCINFGEDITQGKLYEHFIAILSPLAEFEVNLPSERARLIKKRDRQKNRYLGGNAPIGFVVDNTGQLRDDGTRGRTIKLIIRLRAKGLSFRAISIELKKRGINVSHSSVSALLKSAHSFTLEVQASTG